jgi:hypothetical protein
MNATDIDTQMIALQKQMEALQAKKEQMLAPPPAPEPAPVVVVDEEAEKEKKRIEMMEKQIEYYVGLKMMELENEVYDGFDWSSGDGEVSIQFVRRECWDAESVLEWLDGALEDKTKEWSDGNDLNIYYEFHIDEEDVDENDIAVEWTITVSYSYDSLNHGLDYHKRPPQHQLNTPENIDWDKLHNPATGTYQ